MRRTALLAIVLLAARSAPAQFDYGFEFSKAGTAGLQSLKITAGARDAALAEAMVAITNNATAVFVNPGGLGFVEQPQFWGSHVWWLAGSRTVGGVAAVPVGGFVVAASVLRFSIQEFEETTVRQPFGTGRMVGAGDLTAGLAVARRFTDKLTIGLQFKYVRESLDNDARGNVLFDVGTIYYTGFHNLRLGFALQHFGPDMKFINQKFRTPLLFRVGAAEDVTLGEVHHLTTAVDLVHPTDNSEWVNWGLEYEFMQVVALRAGYRFNVERGRLSVGAGLRPPKVAGVGLTVDYAYAKFDETFGGNQQLSVGIAF